MHYFILFISVSVRAKWMKSPKNCKAKKKAKGKYKVKMGINIKKQTTKASINFFLLGNFQSHSYVNKRRCLLFLDTLIYLFVYLYVCVCCRVQHCTPPKIQYAGKRKRMLYSSS